MTLPSKSLQSIKSLISFAKLMIITDSMHSVEVSDTDWRWSEVDKLCKKLGIPPINYGMSRVQFMKNASQVSEKLIQDSQGLERWVDSVESRLDEIERKIKE